MKNECLPEGLQNAIETITETIRPYQVAVDAVKDNIAPALIRIAEVANQYTITFEQFQRTINQLRPVFDCISSLSAIYKVAEKLSENQFVIVDTIAPEVVEHMDSVDINILAEKYLTTNAVVETTIKACGLDGNLMFKQAVDAIDSDLYNLAILGLIAVLDRILSESSGQIKNVRIKSRCESIIEKLENKGDLYLDELEGKDFLLFISYPKAMESFGQDSDFFSPEPRLLNRHWIMHGRTNKQYKKLDCIKILNMIYGTIRMAQLGEEDEQLDKLSEKKKL